MIAEILNRGSSGAVTAAELSARLGVSRRDIYKHVAKERDEGQPILGDGSGLFLASDEDEMSMYYARKLRQLKHQLHTLRNIRKASRQFTGQGDFFER